MMKNKLQKEPYRWLRLEMKYQVVIAVVQGRNIEGLNRGSSYRYREERPV